VLVEIDAQPPECTGSVGRTKRYISGGDLPAEIPDNSGAGVVSNITVSDFDLVSDVNVTFNVLHGFDDDVDVAFVSPSVINLVFDIGLTGNDFIDTTLDDEAASVIPDASGSAPFTGVFKPVPPATLTPLDNRPAAGTYSLRVADDKLFDRGEFLSWSLTIESPTFARRYDGRAEDSGAHSGGVCSIELLPGAHNVALAVDPFTPGDAIVRYSVRLVDRGRSGGAIVRVSDCAGNTCEVPVCLPGDQPPGTAGDLDGDSDVDLDDLLIVLGGFGCPQVCAGDADGDCDVDLDDLLIVLGNFDS
jgi:subtilisin-like proprotein convertase family protein